MVKNEKPNVPMPESLVQTQIEAKSGNLEGHAPTPNPEVNRPPKDLAETHREFEQLMARTQKKAYNMAYRMTGNRDDAEDLTQEAYLRAYRSFDTYNRQMPFERWFYRILSNLFIDVLRRQPKQKTLSLDQPTSDEEGEENLLLQIPDPKGGPEDIVMREVMDERLQEALAKLPETFRRAVWLCDVEGYSYEEIAHIMNSSIGTVRSRIHRGRTLLRKYLEASKATASSQEGVEKDTGSNKPHNTSLPPMQAKPA